jgi:hypothetical protein
MTSEDFCSPDQATSDVEVPGGDLAQVTKPLRAKNFAGFVVGGGHGMPLVFPT